MTIRERLEQEEAQRLSPRAVCAKDTRGREKPIVPCARTSNATATASSTAKRFAA